MHDQAVVGNPMCHCEDNVVTSMGKDRTHGFGRKAGVRTCMKWLEWKSERAGARRNMQDIAMESAVGCEGAGASK